MKVMNLIEKYLLRFLVLGLVLLVVVQGLMTRDTFRFYLSLDERLEGHKIDVPIAAWHESIQENEEQTVTSSMGSLKIIVKDYSTLGKARVLINDENMGSFSGGSVKLHVVSGDVIEVDTSAYQRPIVFKIEKTTANLTFPTPGLEVTSNQGITMVGKAIVK
ncbi:MAG: hypothetical protein ACM3MK_06160 [Chitinophagales bacterium]